MSANATTAVLRVGPGSAGDGVFAAGPIAKGAMACRFDGDIVTFAKIPAEELRYALWLDTTRWLIPRAPSRFVNHGCEPNCTLVDDPDDADAALLVASRAIATGEELSMAYDLVDAELLAEHRNDPAYA
jgi:hypothetical protein